MLHYYNNSQGTTTTTFLPLPYRAEYFMSSLRKRATTRPGSWFRAKSTFRKDTRDRSPVPELLGWRVRENCLIAFLTLHFNFSLIFPHIWFLPFFFFWRAQRWDVHAVVLLKPPLCCFFVVIFFLLCWRCVCVSVCMRYTEGKDVNNSGG